MPDLGRRERRRRLVHDEHPRVLDERARDLDNLLLPERKRPAGRARLERLLQPLEHGAGLPLGTGGIRQHAQVPGLPAREHVLGDAEMREQRQLLVDDGDARGRGGPGGVESHRLAVEEEPAAGGRLHAREDAHERRLAGAVLADEDVHPSPLDVEVHVVEGDGAPIHLADTFGAQHRQSRHGCTCSSRRTGVIVSRPRSSRRAMPANDR